MRSLIHGTYYILHVLYSNVVAIYTYLLWELMFNGLFIFFIVFFYSTRTYVFIALYVLFSIFVMKNYHRTETIYSIPI